MRLTRLFFRSYFGSVPLKLFWLKPSMTLWILLNEGFLAKHLQLFGTVSVPMALYQIFTFLYVFDYFIFESYMTSTWDILHERYGRHEPCTRTT